MDYPPVLKTPPPHKKQNPQSGIALFMVIAAMTVLSLLVTEFTYVAQINQRMAYDGFDQLKAFYLAKSAFKLSLLRLKAYQTLKGFINNQNTGGGIPGLPKGVLEQIWSFPLFYPFPADIPGMTISEKDAVKTFMESTKLEGKFSALIESESSKLNLNLLLAPFVPAEATGATGPSAPTGDSGTTGVTGPSAPSGSTFNPEKARETVKNFFDTILRDKAESDEDFAAMYRDFRLDDLMDKIYAWVDSNYESHEWDRNHPISPKQAPFFSLTELHMIPLMEDDLYGLFTPSLTVSTTPGINVNTMTKTTLKTLISGITAEEVKDFFEFRDDPKSDNLFKKTDDFFSYLEKNIRTFNQDPQEITRFKENLKARNIRIVVDETEFKITINAHVKQSTKVLEAMVTLLPPQQGGTGTSGTPQPNTGAPPLSGPGGSQQKKNDSGIKITFMRIL